MIDRPTMQAAILDAHGAPFRVSAISRPVPGKDQVLVRIAASSLSDLVGREQFVEDGRRLGRVESGN